MNGQIELNPRLIAAAKLMGRNHTVYDIGSDHGLLPLFLLQEGNAQHAVLSDISTLSLDKARKNAEKYQLTASVTFHVGDGLSGLTPGKDDCISICGMGGVLQSGMLKKHPLLPCPVVLQANSERMALRRALAELGYRIEDEDMVYDAGRFYAVIRAVPDVPYTLSYAEALFGPVLIRKRPDAFRDFLIWRRGIIGKAMPNAKGAEKQALEDELTVIGELLCRQE